MKVSVTDLRRMLDLQGYEPSNFSELGTYQLQRDFETLEIKAYL